MMHPSENLVRRAESFAEICICTPVRMVRGCPRHSPGDSGTPESHHHMLIRIIENQEKIMTELSQAQTDINTAVEVVTGLLTDVGDKLADVNTQLGTLATDLLAIQQQIANGQPVDTSALNTMVGNVAAVQASLDSTSAALDTAVANVTAVASPPAPAVPAEPVAGGDTGSAS
jgi:peptidoglycan hydrolase CwlO-like protein